MVLTFLIPVYNALPYLRECVESCVRWPWPDKEIVLVDDGSTDGSGALCDSLTQEYATRSDAEREGRCRFRVIHQPNGGVSRARNAGLDAATGDWVWMVDADDRLLGDEAVRQQVAAEATEARLAQAQRVVTGFVWEEAGRTDRFGASPGDLPYNLWRCWFSRAIIERHRLRFTAGRKYAEDQEFIWRYALCMAEPLSGHTLALDAPAYHYTMRPGSAMTRPGMKRKMARDIAAVDLLFLWRAALSGRLARRWVWMEWRRMLKTLWVTLRR